MKQLAIVSVLGLFLAACGMSNAEFAKQVCPPNGAGFSEQGAAGVRFFSCDGDKATAGIDSVPTPSVISPR